MKCFEYFAFIVFIFQSQNVYLFLNMTDLPYHCSKKLENSRIASAVVFNLYCYVAQMTLGKNWVTHCLV